MGQWSWLVVGVVFTVIGGGMKLLDVIRLPGVFEYAFFSGNDYILLILGLVLIIVGLCQELLFEADDESGPSVEKKI